MFETIDFISDPTPSKIQADVDDTDPIICANTPNVSGESKKEAVDQFFRKLYLNKSRLFCLLDLFRYLFHEHIY